MTNLTELLERSLTTSLKGHPRIRHALLVPSTFITISIDTITNIGSLICAVKAGTFLAFCNKKDKKYFGLLFAKPFSHFVRVMNPRAAVGEDGNVPGLLTSPVHLFFRKAQRSLSKKGSISRHFLARVLYVGMVPCCVVTRVADGIIGVALGVLALLTGGQCATLNYFAYHALQAPDLVNDLFHCCIGVISPSAANNSLRS
jgi:hypothetical protein